MFIAVWFLLILPVVECKATQSATCNCRPVRVADSEIVKPSQMTSSSCVGNHLNAAHARFNDRYAWCPGRNHDSGCVPPCGEIDPFRKNGLKLFIPRKCKLPGSCRRRLYGEWLQLDLGRVRKICGVATQTRKGGINNWAAKYKVMLSDDGNKWDFYSENGTEKVFRGYTKTSSVLKHFFKSPVSARFIRFYPRNRKGMLSCMRVEVFVREERWRTRIHYRAAEIGGSLRFQCSVHGNQSSIEWLKNGKPLTGNKYMQHKVFAIGDVMYSTVVINYVTYEQKGVYSCLTKVSPCSNIIYEQKFDVRLYLNNKDSMSLVGRVEEDHEMNLGEQLNLTCTARYTGPLLNADGSSEKPLPIVVWVKDIWLVNGSHAQKTNKVNEDLTFSSTLVISPITCQDEGIYRCIAINYRHPKVWHEKRFRVQIKKPLVNKKAALKVHKKVWTGGQLRLHCRTKGIAPPKVKWLKDGKPVDSNKTHSRRIKIGKETIAILEILPVTCQNQGVYSCIVGGMNQCPVIAKVFHINVMERRAAISCKTKQKPKEKQETNRTNFEKFWMQYYNQHSKYEFWRFCHDLEISTKDTCFFLNKV